jgi:hypothetical protein
MRARFDPELELIAERGADAFHPVRESLSYAYVLLQAQGRDALAQAQRILRRALGAQERQADNIHCGGFKWMWEDQGVTDLNAVQFALEQILPLYLDYGDWLDAELRAEMLHAVRLGAAELERLDVSVAYTNIALLDTLNTVLAGQVLGDAHLLERGRRRLDEWIAFTCRSGAVPEYNSPTYGGVDLQALAELAERAADPVVALKARLMYERLWLHIATHYHHPSAQLAGPHSRAYHNDVTGGICSIKLSLYRVLEDERLLQPSTYAAHRQTPGSVRRAPDPALLPTYLRRLLAAKPQPYLVQETADVDAGVDLYTYMTPTYALGSVSTSSQAQADRLILYYRKDAAPGYGVLFSRYLLNEKSFGSFYHATDRSTANNINEEGQFWGMQHENKSIALYGLLPQHEPVHSLKTEVFILNRAGLDALWVNGAPVGSLPLELAPLDTLLVADGNTFIALRPLAPSNLGRRAPIILQERDGELALSIYNYYQGEAKRFWEYSALGGPFYKGNLRAGYILEVGDRAQFGDFEAFRIHIERGAIEDRMQGSRRVVRYASGADLLEIEVDLFTNRLVRRAMNGVEYHPPMLSSPTAVQASSGDLRLSEARLRCGAVPAWLVADEEDNYWAAVNPSNECTPWRLETPTGVAATAAFGCGRMVWRGRERIELEVLSAGQRAPLRVETGDRPLRLLWNGRDVSDECVLDALSRARVLPVGDRA